MRAGGGPGGGAQGHLAPLIHTSLRLFKPLHTGSDRSSPILTDPFRLVGSVQIPTTPCRPVQFGAVRCGPVEFREGPWRDCGSHGDAVGARSGSVAVVAVRGDRRDSRGRPPLLSHRATRVATGVSPGPGHPPAGRGTRTEGDGERGPGHRDTHPLLPAASGSFPLGGYGGPLDARLRAYGTAIRLRGDPSRGKRGRERRRAIPYGPLGVSHRAAPTRWPVLGGWAVRDRCRLSGSPWALRERAGLVPRRTRHPRYGNRWVPGPRAGRQRKCPRMRRGAEAGEQRPGSRDRGTPWRGSQRCPQRPVEAGRQHRPQQSSRHHQPVDPGDRGPRPTPRQAQGQTR